MMSEVHDDNSTPLQFGLEILLLVYILLLMPFTVERYMIPSLLSISKTYGISKDMTGILLSFGVIVPEITTNFISVFDDDPRMMEFALGYIIGSAIYDYTICMFVASLFPATKMIMGKMVPYEQKINLKTFGRDVCFYLCSIGVLGTFFYTGGRIELWEAILLVSMFPVYIIVGIKLNQMGEQQPESGDLEEKQSMKSKEMDNTLNLSTKEDSPYFDDANPEDQSETDILRDLDEISEDVKRKRSKDKMQQLEMEKESAAAANPHEMEHEENWLSAIALPMRIIFEKILSDKTPVLTVCVILIVFFQFIKHILYMVGKISALFHLTPVFIGLCVICWGSNINDVMNLTVAHKKGVLQLGMTAVFGSQVLNILLCLGMPWATKMLMTGTNTIEFLSGKNLVLLLQTAFVIVLVSFVIILTHGLTLNRKAGTLLVGVYIVYFVIQYYLHQCGGAQHQTHAPKGVEELEALAAAAGNSTEKLVEGTVRAVESIAGHV